MKKWHLFFILCLPSILLAISPVKIPPPRTLSSSDKPPTIKVLLLEESKGVVFEATGPFAIFNPENGKKISSGRTRKRFYLHSHQEGIKWGEDFLGIFQLQIIPTKSTTTFLIDGIQYTEPIEIYHVEGKLSFINEVEVETFLKGTLTEKISPDLPPAVLDSISIIARTNAYYAALLNHSALYHCTAKKTHYRGIGLTKQNIPLERAVDRTRYLVMTYQNQPFPSTWTKHCAGKTASYSQIFRKKTPVPPGVNSLFAANDRNETYWSFICPAQEVAQIGKLNRVTGIELFSDPFSNKIYALRIRDGNHSENIDFFTLQNQLGKERLKSNDFTVSIQGNLLSFEGYGRGVGVGLCLFSATHFSNRGDEAPQILHTFFPHTDIEKMDTYPKMIISSERRTFVTPRQGKQKKMHPKTLHQ